MPSRLTGARLQAGSSSTNCHSTGLKCRGVEDRQMAHKLKTKWSRQLWVGCPVFTRANGVRISARLRSKTMSSAEGF